MEKPIIGGKWTTYLVNQKGEKVFDKNRINEVATVFYSQHYEDKSKRLIDEEECIIREEVPHLLEYEVEAIAKKLKKGKASGADNISNEH